MVSDSDLVTRLRDILRSSDLDTATPASVRRQLEADFGVDLADKKAFIREQIDVFLESDGGEGDKTENQKVEKEEYCHADENNEVEEVEDDEDGSDDEGKNERSEKVKKRRGGFNKLCQLSPQLEKFAGVSQLARTEVVKKIWAYIRENSLQDPKNRRNIICDESLHSLFRVKTINMFQMNKALSKHIWPLGDGDGRADNMKEDEDEALEGGKEKDEKNKEMEEDNEEESEEEENKSERRSKKRKSAKKADPKIKKRGGGGGFTKVCSLSPELQAFTGVPVSARTEVVKMLWSYIKEKDLQDPSDKRKIVCDEKLHSLFRVDSINMFQMNKQLSKHIWPLEDDADKSPKKGKQNVETEEGSH